MIKILSNELRMHIDNFPNVRISGIRISGIQKSGIQKSGSLLYMLSKIPFSSLMNLMPPSYHSWNHAFFHDPMFDSHYQIFH